MPIFMIIINLQISCDTGDCTKFFKAIAPGAGSHSMLDSGSLTPKPQFPDQNIDVGGWPKDSAADDLEPTLHPFKMPTRDTDLINNPEK